MVETLTSRFIIDCWKKQEFPLGFDDSLEHYLEVKRRIFMDIRIKDVNEWLTPLILSIEVGLKRNYNRFAKHRDFWKLLFENKKWSVDLEKGMVVWRT